MNKIKTVKHTETPWAVELNADPIMIYGKANNFPIGEVGSCAERFPIDEANVAFIVRACNSHEALLRALKALTKTYENEIPYRADDWHEGDRVRYLEITAAREAITKAEELTE